MQDEFAPRQREMAAQQKDLKAKEEKLQRDGAVMAENERRNAEKDLREGQRDLARKQNEYVEDLNVRRNEELGKLQRSLLQEVQTYARASGYDLVVGDGVLFVNESLDITPQVLSALQARFKTGGGCGRSRLPARQARGAAGQAVSSHEPRVTTGCASEPGDGDVRTARPQPGRTRRPLRLHSQGDPDLRVIAGRARWRARTARPSRFSPIRAIAAICSDTQAGVVVLDAASWPTRAR